MNRHQAPSQTKTLLESLRATVSGFAEREEELEREHRNRCYVAKRNLEEACAAEESTLETDLTESDLYFAGLRAQSEKRNKERLAAITRAYVSARQNFNVRAEGQRGSKISNIQQQTVAATRDKENALEGAAAAYENFKSEISGDREQFIHLKRHARASFRGYWQFLLNISGKRASRWKLGETGRTGDEEKLVTDLRQQLASVEEDLANFDHHPLPKLFKFIPFVVILVAVIGAGLIVASQKNWDATTLAITGIISAGLLAIHTFGKIKANAPARSIAENLERSRRIFNASQERAKDSYDKECARIEKEHTAKLEKFDSEWGNTQASAEGLRARGWKKLDQQKRQQGKKSKGKGAGKQAGD